MTRPRGRRKVQQHVVSDKHDHWGPDVSPYEARLFALAGDMLDEMAPRPAQQVPTSGHGRSK